MPTPTFTQWLMATGVISDDEVFGLHMEYDQFQRGLAPLKTYDNAPRTFTQFVARKYPQQFIVYQTMRRLTQ